MLKLILISKTKTTNLGNMALTSGIRDLFCNIKNVDTKLFGRPLGLEIYTIEKLNKSKKPIVEFENWVNLIVKKVNHLEEIPFESIESEKVKLTKIEFVTGKLVVIKSYFKSLIKFFLKDILYRDIYFKRLKCIQSADLLVYSGAGEVGDNNVFLRQLLELAVAQALGIKTAAVNQSIVIHTSLFKELIGKVYGNMYQIVVRGSISESILIQSGVDKNIIKLAPDSALTKEKIKQRQNSRKKLIGINFTPKTSFHHKQFKTFINRFESEGYKFEYVTNEPLGDLKVRNLLFRNFSVGFGKYFTDYNDYSKYLSQFDLIISARLHTCILALNSETPIIPIEGNSFKTKELLTYLNYPLNVISHSDENLVMLLEENVEKVLNGKIDFENYFHSKVDEFRRQVENNANWVNHV